MLRSDYGGFIASPPGWPHVIHEVEPPASIWLPPLRLGLNPNHSDMDFRRHEIEADPFSTWRMSNNPRSTLDTWF